MSGEGAEAFEGELAFPPFNVPVAGRRVADPRGTVLLLPALGTRAGRYETVAEALAARRLNVLVPELPGTGGSLPRPSRRIDYGYGDLVERYLPDLAGLARQQFPGVPLVIAGHSIGGQVAVLSARCGHVRADGLLTLAAGHIDHRNWDGFDARKVHTMAVVTASLTTLLGYFPGQHLGFGGPQARTLMMEWARTIRSGRFPDFSKGDAQGAATPALSVGYEGDFLSPRRSVEGLAALAAGQVRQLPVNWPGNPHSSWTRYPASTVQLIDDWLVEQRLAAPA